MKFHSHASIFVLAYLASACAMGQSIAAPLSIEARPETVKTAQETPSFLGIKIGQPSSDSLPLCPSVDTGGGKRIQDPEASDPNGKGYLACIISGEDDIAVNVSHLIPFKMLTIGKVDGKVASVWTDFGSDRSDTIAKALKEKYGEPTTDTEIPVQTKTGGQFKQRQMRWVGPNLIIEFRNMSNNLDTGSLQAMTPAYAEEMKVKEKASVDLYKSSF